MHLAKFDRYYKKTAEELSKNVLKEEFCIWNYVFGILHLELVEEEKV